jgi:hypothetical protein
MSDTPKNHEDKSAAEIASGPAPKPEPKAETKPEPKPAPVVKDDKWLDTEIAHTEDKLRTLREQKKAASAPVPAPAKKKTGWECEDLA